MNRKRRLLWLAFLLSLPLLVAAFDLGLGAAALLVLLALAWRWGISLSTFVAPEKLPELELETISASHFAEKVRWCLDRLGVAYIERPAGGTLGAFFLGRTVPLLRFRTGAVYSRIGNSSEILRYLWGRYGIECGERAAFLEPSPEQLEYEGRIDRCGRDLQIWVYHHLLGHRELTLRAWGAEDPALPAWQRLALRALFPLLRFLIRRSFRITPRHAAKATANISALLADAEQKLADGRRSLLGGDAIDFVDISFASIMALWLQPAGFGAGAAEGVKVSADRLPGPMRQDIDNWRESFPKAAAFIEQLYRQRTTA